MGASWSRQLETQYGLRLSVDSRDWLDHEVWLGPGGAEFHEPLTPQQLLDPEPGLVWGGFMLPDTLPWIGNGYGDWLCVRIDERSQVSEIVHWSHAGGGWLPVGQNLPEALLYDVGRQRLFARMAELVEPELPPQQQYRYANWAKNWIWTEHAVEVPNFWEEPVGTSRDTRAADPLRILNDRHLARFAVARDLVLRHLESPLKACGDRPFARQLGVPWEPEFVRWLFDGQLVPMAWRTELAKRLRLPAEQILQQDWPRAEALALQVVAARSDLGWPFDLLGWAAERRGEMASAVQWYVRGVKASIFSDEATRLRTHWFAEDYGKFAAARLDELRSHVPDTAVADPYVHLYLDDDRDTLRERVGAYWLAQARTALSRQDWSAAYHGYYQAGWDLGWQSLQDFDEVLGGLETAAHGAGWTGRAALAALHRRNL